MEFKKILKFKDGKDVYSSLSNLFAHIGLVLLVYSFLNVLYNVANVVGSSYIFSIVLIASCIFSVFLSTKLSFKHGMVFFFFLVVLSSGFYFMSLSSYFTLSSVFTDSISLLSGGSVFQILNIQVWLLSFLPLPIFLCIFSYLKNRYIFTVFVGLFTVLIFALTGDAGKITVLLGTIGGFMIIGFKSLDSYGFSKKLSVAIFLTLLLMIVSSIFITLVPVGEASLDIKKESTGSGFAKVDKRYNIGEKVSLSRKTLFTVDSDNPSYWMVSAYDRYTGKGWINTGTVSNFEEKYENSGNQRKFLTQRYEIKEEMKAMPSVWKPISVYGHENAKVNENGGLRADQTLKRNDSYIILSSVLELEKSSINKPVSGYPEKVRKYLQVPDTTPDRINNLTSRITSGKKTPYLKAIAIERWLEKNKNYSLTVDRPEGSVADVFTSEMSEGYCVYFATSMAVMLRTQEIPARFVTGFTPGKKQKSNLWNVREIDSHAWVQVYIPNVGWVPFDPTPSDPRQRLEQTSLNPNLNYSDSESNFNIETGTENSLNNSFNRNYRNDSLNGNNYENQSIVGGQIQRSERNNGTIVASTTRNDTNLFPDWFSKFFAFVFSLSALLYFSGQTEKIYSKFKFRYQYISGSPEKDVRLASKRLEYFLACDYRERKENETIREYIEDISPGDEKVHRFVDLYEEIIYSRDFDKNKPKESVKLVDKIIRERTLLPVFSV